MGLVVPNAIEVAIMQNLLNTPLTLRLFGNAHTPVGTDSVGAYTEIAGGGYANKPLIYSGWSFQTSIAPSSASYTIQTWIFTGVINAPGTIYGYYITRNSDGALLWAESFPAANIPFGAVAGSKIVVLPRFTAESQF
jgi:hypothetical protein